MTFDLTFIRPATRVRKNKHTQKLPPPRMPTVPLLERRVPLTGE